MEAGAQGEHKLQRGYLPNFTYSCHYMADPVLRSAVGKFLAREEQQVIYRRSLLLATSTGTSCRLEDMHESTCRFQLL